MKFPMQADNIESARTLASGVEIFGEEFWVKCARELIAQAILTLSIQKRSDWTVGDLISQVCKPWHEFEQAGRDGKDLLAFGSNPKVAQAIALTAAHAIEVNFGEQEDRAA